LSFDSFSVRVPETRGRGYLSRDWQVAAIAQKIVTESGAVRISLVRRPGAAHINGNGNVLMLILGLGSKKGDSVLRVVDLRIRNSHQNSPVAQPLKSVSKCHEFFS
jgi:hypothetical protein